MYLYRITLLSVYFCISQEGDFYKLLQTENNKTFFTITRIVKYICYTLFNFSTCKNTFVKLYGLPKCEELVQKYTNVAIEAVECFEDTEFIIALAKSLTDRKK